jgi:hypothetical protein
MAYGQTFVHTQEVGLNRVKIIKKESVMLSFFIILTTESIKILMPQCGTNQNGAKRQRLFVFAFLHDRLLGHGFLALSIS